MIRGKYLPLWRLHWSWLLQVVMVTSPLVLRMETTMWWVMRGFYPWMWWLIVIVSVWVVIVVIIVG